MMFQRTGKKLHANLLRQIRNDPDPAIDRAYAERCVTKENQEKENTDPKVNKLIVTLPNGGKSKAARSKQNRTLGVFQPDDEGLRTQQGDAHSIPSRGNSECSKASAGSPESCCKW
jgi:hypothetical protein